ncbi:MAG: hypothetical protein LC637_09195 [Xanthomonadaceae bacterium]|nr:hypothetical protein [Xanthomonadaceae bacterium]
MPAPGIPAPGIPALGIPTPARLTHRAIAVQQ